MPQSTLKRWLKDWTTTLLRRCFPWFESGALNKGFEEGHAKGFKAGYSSGFDAAKDIWEINDSTPIAPPPSIDTSLYGPEKFQITQDLRSRMDEETNRAVRKKILRDLPTGEQWKMIFSDAPSTCVIAGAGSGKSTTLILRVVFMVMYLQIPIEEITMVSFTKKSCAELRESLVRVFRHWDLHLSELQAKSLVRTFHSLLTKQAKHLLPGVKFFENLGREKKKIRDPIINGEENDEVENPFSTTNLKNEQRDVLQKVYVQLFNSDQAFRRATIKMLESQFGRDLFDESIEYSNWLLDQVSGRDRTLVDVVNRRWRTNTGLWPIDGIEEGPCKITLANRTFYANGRVKATGACVFLGPCKGKDELFKPKELLRFGPESGHIKVISALSVKRNLVSRFYGGEPVYINSKKMMESLGWLVQDQSGSKSQERTAPVFDVKLQGEIRPEGFPEALYTQASFMENIGLSVSEAMRRITLFRKESPEYFFLSALGPFWRSFTQYLDGEQILTYNRCFKLFTQPSRSRSGRSERAEYCQFRHLLIDEFQDISKPIVDWVVASQRRAGDQNAFLSIMAVGDDWQSIYGWRGSSPEFFLNFDKYFPTHQDLGGSDRLFLTANFRSIERIVSVAQSMLKKIARKTTKTCIAKVPADSEDRGIELLDDANTGDKWLDTVARLIRHEHQRLESKTRASGGMLLLVMARTNTICKRVSEEVGPLPEVEFLTIHRAKGLQAEATIIIGDSPAQQRHVFRNMVYDAAELHLDGYSYDQSQKDETYRLAYVALTRAKRDVYWIVKSGSETADSLHSSDRVVRRHLMDVESGNKSKKAYS